MIHYVEQVVSGAEAPSSVKISDELRHQLGVICAQEERPNVDWSFVAQLCRNLSEDVGINAPVIVQEYLASFERRRSDPGFGHAQRSNLVQNLRTST